MAVLLGRLSAGVATDFNATGWTANWGFTALASGNLKTIWAQPKVANAGTITLGIYSDDAANACPLNRLGVATATNSNTIEAFSAVLAQTVPITSGVKYWLGWRNSAESMDYAGDAATNVYAEQNADFPASWGAVVPTGDGNAIIWGESEEPPTPYSVMMTGLAPVAYWKLGEGSGTFDDVGSANADATSSGTPTQVAGLLPTDTDYATAFTSGYATGTTPAALKITSDLTLMAIVKDVVNDAGFRRILSVSNLGSPFSGYILGTGAGTAGVLSYFSSGKGSWDADTAVNLADGLAHHVAVVHAGTNVQFWVDGVLRSTLVNTTNKPGSTSENFSIAADRTGAVPFAGSASHLAVFDRVITPAQVRAAYASAIKTGLTQKAQSPLWDDDFPFMVGPNYIPPKATQTSPGGLSDVVLSRKGPMPYGGFERFTFTRFHPIILAGGQTVTPAGLGSAAAFGTLIIVPGGVSVPLAGLGSAGSFGTLKTNMRFSVLGLGSAAQFGTLKTNIAFPVTGLGSAAQFGTIKTNIAFTLSGLGSAAQFGTLTIAKGGVAVILTGLGSAASFGSLQANMKVVVSGLGSAAAFGTPTASAGALTAVLTGLGSAAQFGTIAYATGNVQVPVSALASAASFGTIKANQAKIVTGLGSAAAFGALVIVKGGVVIQVFGLGSAAQFGALSAQGGGSPSFSPAIHGGRKHS